MQGLSLTTMSYGPARLNAADTEKFYTVVQEIILARYNKTFDWSLKAKMMGRKAMESARIFVEETGISDSSSAEDFLVEREAMLQKLFPTKVVSIAILNEISKASIGAFLFLLRISFYGRLASRFILGLSNSKTKMKLYLIVNIRTFIDDELFINNSHAGDDAADAADDHLYSLGIWVPSSHKLHFSLKTQRHGELFSLMHHTVLGDDPEVKQGKPSPDVFLAAARRFEGGPVDPQKILVFEDAPEGVLAAKNAGMCVVMVPDPRHDTADEVSSSLLDLNPKCWGLPPFEDVES
ncbi:hypothetical protein SADUNF_Sadunf06G0133700 [Salix dunnii]|uniref:Uncharacterized protein n=1 Tax=Salix dunnii TaxID=1413687 RepID=A0A835N0T8_9ROSI|nr:hypothetical protein SADUNF_Sadunf06G0133700 [Salix dunnii]